MTPTKLLIGQILVVLAIILASIWVATQWVAAQLAYQLELGAPWFIAFGRPIYQAPSNQRGRRGRRLVTIADEPEIEGVAAQPVSSLQLLA